MSKRDSESMDTTGYVLSEDSQFRLKKLHGHMVFLSHLAQPRTHDEEQEWGPEIRMGELAVCLELLAEQAELVLEQVSWSAKQEADRKHSHAAPDGKKMEGEAVDDEADKRCFAFGVTLDQVDDLIRLLDMITAHGDVVFSAHDAELAIGTLALVGHAVFDDARAAKEIVDQVNSQRLGGSPKPPSGIREERAIYGARTSGRDGRPSGEAGSPLRVDNVPHSPNAGPPFMHFHQNAHAFFPSITRFRAHRWRAGHQRRPAAGIAPQRGPHDDHPQRQQAGQRHPGRHQRAACGCRTPEP